MASTILPALFPPCFVLTEVGPVIIGGENRENLLGVSVDGIVHCINDGIDCPYDDESCDHTKIISLEIKCPYNCENPYTDMLYDIRNIYVPQITSQMFVFSSELGILATKSENSIIVKRLTNDNETWEQQSQILLDFYDKAINRKPSKFHPHHKQGQEKIKFFAEHSLSVLMEVPEVCGFDSNSSPRDGDTAFRKRISPPLQQFDCDKFVEELSITLAECDCVFTDAHNICRSKASEILLFMLSDSDRMKLLNDDTYTHVIGYGMKGYSLPVNILRQMVEFLRNQLKEYEIPVLCESFDGQWANLAFKDINGEPLTLYHLLGKSWEEAHNMSWRNILQKLKNISTIEVVDLVEVCQHLTYGKTLVQAGNFYASIDFHNDEEPFITLSSKGGHLKEDMLLCHASLSKVKNIDDNSIQLHDAELRIKKKLTGIHPEDLDIVSTIEPSLVKDIIKDLEDDPDTAGIHLEDFLYSPRLQLLSKILSELQNNGKSSDWEIFTEDDLFPDILMDKEKLLAYSKHDIDIIVKVIEKNTEKNLCFKR